MRNIMICKYCGTEMKTGFAIFSHDELSRCHCFSTFTKVYDVETLEINECLKCPKCGFSEYNDGEKV